MRGFKRRLQCVAIWALGITAALVLVIYGLRFSLDRKGKRELQRVTARLDLLEPDWRIEAIEQVRAKSAPPPDQNSARIVLEASELLEAEQNKAWRRWRHSEAWSGRGVSPRLPDDRFRAGLTAHREPTAEVRRLARNLRQFPDGQHAIEMLRNPYLTLLPHVQKTRDVATLLEYDALLAALENDVEGGIDAALAGLNTSRSISDEPFLISQLVRLGCCRISSQSAMQVLAWSEPRAGLAELQAAYRAEADVPFLLNGLRGERAILHRMFDGLESGELTYSDLVIHGLQKENSAIEAGFYLYKGLLPGDHAKALEVLSAYIAAAKLPPHEQRAALAAIPIPPGPPADFRYVITRLLLPACETVAIASLRIRAELLSASTAIACERFRIANGRWPTKLEELSKDLLPELPLDPFTGTPLLLHRFPDGIAVYSVGDGDAASLRRRRDNNDALAELGIGWRLWDAKARRQPPLAVAPVAPTP